MTHYNTLEELKEAWRTEVYTYVKQPKQVWCRKFTDQALIDAAAHCRKVKTLAKQFNCTNSTIRGHAKRLGLKLQGYTGVNWTPEQDAWVTKCSEGKCTVAEVTRNTGHASSSIQKRAAYLGLNLVIQRQGISGPTFGSVGKNSYEYVLTVGKVDRLLERLYAEFGSPRNEVYPGARV